MPLPIGLGGGGMIGLVVILLLYLFLGGGGGGVGVDPGVDGLPQAPSAQGQTTSVPADEPAQFVAAVVADVQQTWKQIFERAGRTYESTRLVLFDAPTQTGCGIGSPATGPFYCPADHRVYLDIGFFRELSQRFGAPGDFAQAYVIAHEFGHHVQNVMGVSREVARSSRRTPTGRTSCRSGWSSRRTASPASGATPPTRRESSSQAISRRVSQRPRRWATTGSSGRRPAASTASRGRTAPSEQRTTWFKKGFDSGDPAACDTFSGDV